MAGPDLTIDTSGNPRVEVFFNPSGLAAGTARLRIYRFSEGREWLVRGGVDVAPGVAANDFECPFYTPMMYRAEMFNAAGLSLGFTDVSDTTVAVDDVWVHNPLVPSAGVALGPFALADGTAQSIVRPVVGEVFWPEDATVGRWIGARRRGVTGMPFGLAVESIEDADALQGMLGDYVTQQLGVLCIRTPPPVRMPRTLFAAVSSPEEVDVDVKWGGQRTDILFEATEVAPPFPGIVAPLLSYADLDAAFPTYSAQDAAFPSYTARDRAYQYAGAGG